MVPLSASSKRPLRSDTASVKAPFLWPNISLSNNVCDTPPRLTLTKGLPRRGLLRCTASAINSLPVPLSPVTKMEAFVRATRFTVASTSINALLRPMMWLRSKPSLSVRGSSASCPPAVSSRAVSMRCIRAALFHGLVMKSKAPACMPCTARGMLPHAVIKITGVWGQNSLTCFNKVNPS